jgi:hypothetical protein
MDLPVVCFKAEKAVRTRICIESLFFDNLKSARPQQNEQRTTNMLNFHHDERMRIQTFECMLPAHEDASRSVFGPLFLSSLVGPIDEDHCSPAGLPMPSLFVESDPDVKLKEERRIRAGRWDKKEELQHEQMMRMEEKIDRSTCQKAKEKAGTCRPEEGPSSTHRSEEKGCCTKEKKGQ